MSGLTQKRLKEVLHYDPVTGVFTWLAGQRKGKTAGCKDRYTKIRVDGRLYYGHRLVWLYVHGEWPAADIDHRHLNKNSTKLADLRPATRSQNLFNISAHRDNKSGFKGVCFFKPAQRWKAEIMAQGKRHHLGYFDTAEQAAKAYAAASKKLHGEFARAA